MAISEIALRENASLFIFLSVLGNKIELISENSKQLSPNFTFLYKRLCGRLTDTKDLQPLNV